jgi:anti-anti-sigma regulatory factor
MSELATMEAVEAVRTSVADRAPRKKTNNAKPVGRPKAMTMVIDGEIGRDEMAEIGEMLITLSMDGVTDLVIDLRGVSHLDYRAVPALQRRAEVFRKLGGDIKLANLSSYLFTIFQAAGAQDAFDFFADVGDAQKAFRGAVMVQGH